MMNHFSLSAFKILCLSLVRIWLLSISFSLSCLKFTELLGRRLMCSARLGKFLVIISMNILSIPFSFLLLGLALYYFILWYSIGPLGSVHFFPFFFFFSLLVRCSNFNWLIFKFADSFFCWLKMLVNPSSEFFISVFYFSATEFVFGSFLSFLSLLIHSFSSHSIFPSFLLFFVHDFL